MYRIVLLILFLHCFFPASYSQVDTTRDVGLLYRYEMSGGILAHSNGFGANFRKGKHLTGYKKRMLEIELVNMKHPKEYKTPNPANGGNVYIFGKQNSFAILRTGIGIQKVIASKAGKGGVEVRYLYNGGASIGFLKPVYLEIIRGIDIVREKFDPLKHNTDNIYGRAPFTKGLTETKILPGIYGKFGLNFESGGIDDKIRAIETGVSVDLYYKKAHIMAIIDDDNDANKQFFISFYINIMYGNKW